MPLSCAAWGMGALAALEAACSAHARRRRRERTKRVASSSSEEEAMEVGADVRVNPLDEHTFVRGRRIFATIFAAGRGLIASLT